MNKNEKEMKSWEYIIQTKKEHIDFINKIIEAYDGLGNVRTLDNQNGLIKILTNSYLLDDMDKAIETLKQKIDAPLLGEIAYIHRPEEQDLSHFITGLDRLAYMRTEWVA